MTPANRRTSPLYYFLKSQIDFLGKGNIRVANLNKVKAMVDNMITFCCLPQEPRAGSHAFVRTAHTLIKGMTAKDDIKRLQAVKTYLDNAITCCL